MTSNLQEFLAMAMLVTSATTFVAGFRYAIIVFGRREEEALRRIDELASQPKEKQ